MSDVRTSDIVLSLTGRDKGELMLVVAEEGDFLLLTDARGGRKTRSANAKSTFPDRGRAMSGPGSSSRRAAG